jgi:hypothetical protein
MVTVDFVRAIESGTPLTFFPIVSYEKIILTNISPMRV